MAWRGARSAEARALLDSAAAVFEAEGLTRRAARVSSVLAEIDYRDGHPPAAVAPSRGDTRGARGRASPTRSSQRSPRSSAASSSSTANTTSPPRGSRSRSSWPRRSGCRRCFAQALTSKSIFYTYRNRLEEGRILLEGALERALAGDFHAAAMRAFNNLAVVLESSDRYAEAVELTDRALELARRDRRPGLGGALPRRPDQRPGAARPLGRGARAPGRVRGPRRHGNRRQHSPRPWSRSSAGVAMSQRPVPGSSTTP